MSALGPEQEAIVLIENIVYSTHRNASVDVASLRRQVWIIILPQVTGQTIRMPNQTRESLLYSCNFILVSATLLRVGPNSFRILQASNRDK